MTYNNNESSKTRVQIPTPDTVDSTKTLERIRQADLPGRLERFTTKYANRVGVRDEFIWKWLYSTLKEVTLDAVPSTERKSLWVDKTIATIFVVILDDLLEDEEDLNTFNEARKIPFERQHVNYDAPEVDEEALRLASEVWAELETSLESAPHFEQFWDMMRFDASNVITSHEYSYLLNRYPEMSNLTELYCYDSHNMSMLMYLDADLMYAVDVDGDELGAIRDIVYLAQEIGRIGNWITTWKREVGEDDYTSGVLVSAVESGTISAQDIRDARNGDQTPPAITEVVEEQDEVDLFYDCLCEKYSELFEAAKRIESVDMVDYAESITELTRHQIAARGEK